MKKKKVDLIPPDKERCQAERKEGCWPDAAHFMIMGPAKLVRCSKKPFFIITEKIPGKDGQIGAMSVCAECLAIAIEQLGADSFTVSNIKDW